MEKQSRRVVSGVDVEERRKHQRIAPEGATAQIASRAGAAIVTFEIRNLSVGGALIAGRIEVEPGTILDLNILLPGAAPIALPACLLRHVGHGGRDFSALRFLNESHMLGHWIGDVVLEGLRAAFPEI